MKKNLIFISLATLAILWSPVIFDAQPTLALQSSENNVTRLRTKIDNITPLVITRGFDALAANETHKAFAIWLNSSIPIIRNNVSIMANTMQGLVDNAVGKCYGYSVIDIFSLTNRTKIIYVESQHEEGAFFWRFTVHETPNKLVITSIDLNTDPSQIMPLPTLTER